MLKKTSTVAYIAIAILVLVAFQTWKQYKSENA